MKEFVLAWLIRNLLSHEYSQPRHPLLEKFNYSQIRINVYKIFFILETNQKEKRKNLYLVEDKTGHFLFRLSAYIRNLKRKGEKPFEYKPTRLIQNYNTTF